MAGGRPAGHGYEMRGLAYLPVSQQFEGRFGRMFRLSPFVPSDARIAEIAALMTENATGADAGAGQPDDPGRLHVPWPVHRPRPDLRHRLQPGPGERPGRADRTSAVRASTWTASTAAARPTTRSSTTGTPGEKLLVGRHDDEDDLPRNGQETALLGDPRNDENTFVSQLQLTMLKFHNKVVDLVEADPALRRGSETRFEAAQRIVRWHYQWLVVHDFLRAHGRRRRRSARC